MIKILHSFQLLLVKSREKAFIVLHSDVVELTNTFDIVAHPMFALRVHKPLLLSVNK